MALKAKEFVFNSLGLGFMGGDGGGSKLEDSSVM